MLASLRQMAREDTASAQGSALPRSMRCGQRGRWPLLIRLPGRVRSGPTLIRPSQHASSAQRPSAKASRRRACPNGGRSEMRKWIATAVLVTALTAVTGSMAVASSAPIVITYAKQCDAGGHCVGTTGSGGTFEMQVDGASFRETGNVAHFTVTEGSFEGAKVHQRSDLDDPVANTWTGELRLMPASA